MKPMKRFASSLRRALGLSAGALLLAGAPVTGMAAIMCSSSAVTVPNNIDGVYLNLVTGANGSSGSSGWDINLYNTGAAPGALYFFWPSTPANRAGGVSTATVYDALSAGAPIGPSQTYIVNSGGGGPLPYANWQTTQTGKYLGIRFNNESTSTINYAWLQLDTGATGGFPAVINKYCYEDTGAEIAAGDEGGGGGTDPVASVTPAALAVTADVGSSATTPLTVANTGGGSLTYAITESAVARAAPTSSYRTSQNAKEKGLLGSGTLSADPHAGQAAAGHPVTLSATDISQMADNTPGDQGVSCGVQGTSTADNSWWRRFYFSEHPAVGASTSITSVKISTGSIAVAGGVPATVNLYTIPHSTAVDTIPTASLTLIGTATTSLTGSLATITVPVTGTVADTVGSDLVVEVHTDGNASGGQFFPGANATAQTHPTFISSSTCGIAAPTATSGIGFPDFHLTMIVTVDGTPPPVGCENPSDIPWLSASPTSGTVAGGASSDVTVTANATGMAAGTYSANVCVATNDTTHAMVSVPVTFTVTSGSGGGDVLTVDLSTANQVTIRTANGTSAATASGSTTTGFLFGGFFANAGTQAIGTTTIVGTATLTAASVPSDGSPSLFRSSDTDSGLNIWSYSATSTTTFTAGQVAFSGTATWTVSPALYAAMLTAPSSGNVYFPADDSGDITTAQMIGTYTVIGGGGGGDPVAVVTPTPLTFSVQAGASATNPLNIANTGGAALTYSVSEAPAAQTPSSQMTASGRLLSKNGARAQGSWVQARSVSHDGSNRVGDPFQLMATQISQMADNTPGDEGVSCGVQGTSTADNSWWRRFYFSEHPAVGASTTVSSVTVSTGSIDVGGLPVTVNLYTIPHSTTVDTIPTGSLTLIGTATSTLTGSLQSITIPVAGTVADTAGSDLVVELHTDGNASGGQWFPGANATTQTHPTFLSSATCGVSTPTTTDAIGFPDFHLTMVVDLDGTPPTGGCQNPADVPWLSETPASGSVAPGASADVAVTANAGALAEGAYSANLCVATNDPTHALITVPVSLTVTAAPVQDGIFCSGFEEGETGACGGGTGTFTQPLQDPSFEATTADAGSNPFWAGTDSNDPSGGTPFYSASSFGIDVHTGDWEVWFGGWRATAETQTFTQSVTIASGGPRFINYWRNVVAAPVGTATLKVYVDGTAVETTDIVANGVDAAWTNKSVDISSYADNATHAIKFEYVTAGSDDGNVFIDDVTIDDHAGSARPR